MENTPNASRLHVAIFGRRNSGKSTLMNAITSHYAAVVSPHPGTTTDTVARTMELHGVGACLFVDTPGFDDCGELGELRVERTLQTLKRIDIAILLCDTLDLTLEREWVERIKQRNVPIITAISKIDSRNDTEQLAAQVADSFDSVPLLLSGVDSFDIEPLRLAILRALPEGFAAHTILGNLVERGDLVMLVMPQDPQAPKGRLILPQVQTLRELLDRGCSVVCSTGEGFESTLATLQHPPTLIVTDSQIFKRINDLRPAESRLTSFSLLMAGYKGDIRAFVDGAAAIDRLRESSRVLIAEACTHAPMSEDIGREKIPRMLRSRVGEGLTIDVVAGRNFPDDLTPYDLIVHCGGCMFNRPYMLSRIEQAQQQQVAITNYGVAIAHLAGIELESLALE
ncbi:MAG: [FeFe] hydrogenase H-cluster maturation GTPase HydF [Rikenellaceae bacterium]